jgi:NAD(P)-dependent dehydrogenase (short-subunit alcohol dehydrogenase family)
MKDVKGKVAVVTGGASGIGLAMCESFAAAGMKIVMADLKDSPMEKEAARLRAGGTEVLTHATDVSQWEQVEALAAATKAKFGGAHVVCNNAGVRSMGRIWETSLKNWNFVLGVDLFGVLHGVKAFVPDMIARGEPGHFVNTSSVAGLMVVGTGNAPYNVSKQGVVALSESLWHELQEVGAPIGVSVLCPGVVPTNLRENSNRLKPEGAAPVQSRAIESHMKPMPAAEVGKLVLDGILKDRFWLLTHPKEYRPMIEQRCRGIVETGEVFRGRAT